MSKLQLSTVLAQSHAGNADKLLIDDLQKKWEAERANLATELSALRAEVVAAREAEAMADRARAELLARLEAQSKSQAGAIPLSLHVWFSDSLPSLRYGRDPDCLEETPRFKVRGERRTGEGEGPSHSVGLQAQ